MKIEILGKKIDLDKPKKVFELFDDPDKKYICCLVNNKLKDLSFEVTNDSKIELLDITSLDGVNTYQATLRYIIAMAVKNVYPKAKISFNYSISRSIFASVSGLGKAFSAENLSVIKNEVDRIIEMDYPIIYKKVSKEETIKYFKSIGYKDKVASIKYRVPDWCHMYECDGYMDYLYTYLTRSTGYIKSYELKLYSPGFLIKYPRRELAGNMPEFNDERVFRDALKEANLWAHNAKCEAVYQVNEIIESKKALELINMCETRHNNQLTHLGDKIVENIYNIKLICVAGPSSSGKTTFTNRLIIELKTRGFDPFMISLDDYYKCKLEEYAIDEEGNPDFESIESLDLDLFDKTIFDLIQGVETQIPKFNFKTRERTFSKPKKLSANQPIIIEGIHGLNKLIAPSIPDENKFKIYIAPIAQNRIDAHTPISISDIRLLRRIVRDNVTRNIKPIQTIKQWSQVRQGEFKWIYPHQNNADFVFNSELSYEICILKKYALPLLEEISTESECFSTARRLIKFLKFYKEISDKWVPCNSILREFIGESIFYTDDIE
ncbi:MAG: hypothetical protein K6F81_04665 [Acholeplasmatales bacterium]|nr:hypothetical protein [Acholeplasmatales bacterium]